MRYIPNYKLSIIKEDEYESKIAAVETEINKVKQVGKFTAFDKTEIYYEYFLTENSKGNVVIVHGLSEFTRKFCELVFYTLNQGYNVFIYDQRCHGLSGRLTKINTLLHVDSFNDYVKDLAYFIDETVLKTEQKPIYLFAHSMGCATASLYMAKNKNKVKKAVFSAPMFEPVVKDVPIQIARMGVSAAAFVLGKKRKFFLSDEFDPNVKFNYVYGLSKARFEHNMKLRKENLCYQSTPLSLGWVKSALTVSKKILSSRIAGEITTPILLLSAEKDKVVKNNLQQTFYEKCKTCSFECIENATHAVLASDENILFKVLNLSFNFFAM